MAKQTSIKMTLANHFIIHCQNTGNQEDELLIYLNQHSAHQQTTLRVKKTRHLTLAHNFNKY